MSGQTRKRNGAADLEIHQGSATRGSQVCEFRGVVLQGESKARSLARRGGRWGQPGDSRGRDVLSLRRKGPEWSGRPFEEAQTHRASAARPSIVTGANGRRSGTEGFSGGVTSSNRVRHECGGFAERSQSEIRRSQDAGKQPDLYRPQRGLGWRDSCFCMGHVRGELGLPPHILALNGASHQGIRTRVQHW
jgi:hypothetical protein